MWEIRKLKRKIFRKTVGLSFNVNTINKNYVNLFFSLWDNVFIK
jgi:hypothetical protein